MIDVPDGKSDAHVQDAAARVQKWLFAVLQVIMLAGFALNIYEQQWMTAAVCAALIGVMFVPALIERRIKIDIPSEFEILAILFVFAAIFLGEVRNYYEQYWWWDILLHTMSGLLLGIFGFLLVYVMNETDRVDLHMRPAFVALFAFLFAVSVGALWEIFEFSMDQLFGLTMQKPMLGDDSGLTDTMFDLVVDTLGAAIITLMSWWFTTHSRQSFVDAMIAKFVKRNPRLFKRK